jgi:DNA-binding beta-propeller fold protein YncE
MTTGRSTRSTPMRTSPAAGLVLVAAIVLACGPAAVAVSSVSPSASPALPAVTPTAAPILPVIKPEAAIAASGPSALAFDGAGMWLLGNPGEISRIDPATNKLGAATRVAPTGWTWGGFGADATALWKADFDANLVYRIDPESLAIVAKIPVAANPDGAGVNADGVWIAQHRGGSVVRIDPATNQATTIKVGHVGPGGPHEIGFGTGSVWVSAGMSTDSGSGGSVVRIDPATNKVIATIPIPAIASACGAFAISDTAVWMSSCFDMPTLVRIDPATNSVVATIDLGGYGGNPVLIDGALWITVRDSDLATDPTRLVRVDPATNTIDRVVSISDTYTGETLLLALGSVWTVDASNAQVLRFPFAAFKG